MSIDRKITSGIEAEQPKFDAQACIQNTVKSMDLAVIDYFTEFVPLAEKFFPEEVVEAKVGQIRITSVEEQLETVKSEFNIGSSTHQVEITGFGDKMIAHAEENGVDYNLDVEQLEQYVEPVAAKKIKEQLLAEQGELFKRGWHIYSDKAGHAVLLTHHKDNGPYLPPIKAVLLDDLFYLNPGMVKDELRGLFIAGYKSRLKAYATYELANHEFGNELVPELVKEFTGAGAWERASISNLLTLSVRFDEIGRQKMDRLQKTGEMNNRRIPNDNRIVTLERSLNHRVDCPAEPKDARLKVAGEYQALIELQHDAFMATRSNLKIEGAEILENPLIYSKEFTGQVISLHEHEGSSALEMVKFIERTGKVSRSTDSTLKDLKRRLPARHAKLEKFKAELGLDFLNRDHFENLITEVAADLRFALSGSPIGEQVTDLAGARRILSKKLIMHTTNLPGGGESWVRNEREGKMGSRADLRDEQFADLILYIVAKTMQQRPADSFESGNSQYRFAAAKLISMLNNDYSQKVEDASVRVAAFKSREANFNKLNKGLGISNQQVELLIRNSRQGKDGTRQLYDHAKFGVLYRTLAFKRMGLIDFKLPATRAVLKELYPKLTSSDWALIGA